MMSLYFVVLLFGLCYGQNGFYEWDIFRPCPNLDAECARAFFSQFGGCTPAYGTLDEVHYPGDLVFPVPHANLTYIWRHPSISGLADTQIKEFYVNRYTGKLVYEVEFGEGVLRSNTVTIKYYFKGREPLELTDWFTITFRKVSITVTVPFDWFYGMSWRERDIYAYFGDDDLPFAGGEGLYNSDPIVLAEYKEMANNMQLGVRESAPVMAPLYFDLYFNDHICSF